MAIGLVLAMMSVVNVMELPNDEEKAVMALVCAII